MKLAENLFLQAIRNRQPQVGLWISLCSPFAADAVASSGFDWALLDMEHAPNELNTVLGQLQAFSSSDTSTMVRPMWNDSVLVKRLLDIGSRNVLFPMVQSAEEAEKAVKATRYPPDGIRGVSGVQRGNKFGRVTDYFDRINNETGVVVQIETQHALNNIESIAKVDGVEGIFFGPADLAADMGKLGSITDPDLWQIIRKAAKQVEACGKPAGTLVFNPDMAASLINDDGFTFVACGSDLGMLARGADNLLASVRKQIKS